MAAPNAVPSTVTFESDFKYSEVTFEPQTEADTPFQPQSLGGPQVPIPAPADPPPPLGVLSNFKGKWEGNGFNSIFRPNSGPPTTTTFDIPVTVPTLPPNPPNENVLELNLTTERLTFHPSLGAVPNRGLEGQNDINLNGVPYLQVIKDVTNKYTGKADGKPAGIHFEPGLWMHVPATTTTPKLAETLVRMASIPHGTTINAQGFAPSPTPIPGPPPFENTAIIKAIDITPFLIGPPNTRIPFLSQDVNNPATARLPQNLAPFIAAGTITDRYLKNPNLILGDANKGKTIIDTIVFKVSTSPSEIGLGGGTDNIAFLEGDVSLASANADAALMEATFWISTVQHKLSIPVWHPGQPPLKIKPEGDHPAPVFHVVPPVAITSPRIITVFSKQIQYAQVVNLNFAKLTWPHVSVATLHPIDEQTVPPEAWK